MRHHITLDLHLRFLYQFAVGTHPLFSEGFGELVRDERGGMETGEGDELPAVA